MIVGLVSTWDDGRLAEDAIRSLLSCCQTVYVLHGPIGDQPFGPWYDRFKKEPRVVSSHGQWDSDAEKRTALLTKTRRFDGELWGIVLDSDELLLHGEQIPALIEWHEANAAAKGSDMLRIPIRLTEPDGTCGVMTGRILRLDLIERYLISSYHIQLKNGLEVSLANGKLVGGGEPDSTALDVTTGFQCRRPLQGEPHIFHRSHLRPPQRQAERQSVAEGSVFDALVKEAGLGEVHGEKTADSRSAIWLPQS